MPRASCRRRAQVPRCPATRPRCARRSASLPDRVLRRGQAEPAGFRRVEDRGSVAGKPRRRPRRSRAGGRRPRCDRARRRPTRGCGRWDAGPLQRSRRRFACRQSHRWRSVPRWPSPPRGWSRGGCRSPARAAGARHSPPGEADLGQDPVHRLHQDPAHSPEAPVDRSRSPRRRSPVAPPAPRGLHSRRPRTRT